MFSLGERCPARIELSDYQMLWLRRRPCAAHHVRRHHECLLEFRHDGPHADLGQRGEEVEWWVRWTLTTSAIEQLAACPATRDDPVERREDGVCLLFEGHPGRHSFDVDQR